MTGKPSRDGGLTLVELLIVLGLLGIIMTALAMTFTVIVRTQPPTETRVDNARSSLGLTTYLPEDVDSTPRGGFNLSPTASIGCTGDPAGSINLLQLTWTETIESTDTFIANYRVVPKGDGSRIVRYLCVNGSPASSVNMTSDLPPIPGGWVPGTAPFDFELVGTDGVSVDVTTNDGEILSLDTRSNNPAETLPPDPPTEYPPVPDGNAAPNAPDVDGSTLAGVAVNVALGVTDPDTGDSIEISPLNPTVSAATPGWTASISGLVATVTPQAAAPENEVGSFTYTAIDPYGQTDTGSVTVTVLPAPVNDPPDAGGPTTVDVDAGSPEQLTLPISDPNNDPLTVTLVGTEPASLDISINPTTNIMTILADGSVTTPISFDYRVSDGEFTDTGTVTVNVLVCTVTSFTPPTASVALKTGNQRLVSDISYSVTYTGPCNNLILQVDHDGNASTALVQRSFASAVSVTIEGHPGGPSGWSFGPHQVTLRNGLAAPVIATANLTTTS
jgi:prepilin-type N-terminal cleavage/methylation domain-containing protein